jgi:type II secretory pathway pseudopilin PulG
MIITLIVSVLVAIAVPNFIAYRDKSRLTSVQATAKQIQDALANYAIDTTGDFPPTGAIATWLDLRTLVQPYSGLYPVDSAQMGIRTIAYVSPTPTTYTLQLVVIVSSSSPVDTIVVTPQDITKQ